MTWNSFPVGAIAMFVLTAMVFILSGCKGTNYAPLKQSLVAEDAAVVTTTGLVTSGVISKSDAKPILAGARIVLAADIAWKAALDAKNTPATLTASSDATTAQVASLRSLNDLQRGRSLPLDSVNGHARLTGSARTPTAPPGTAGAGEVTAVLAIIQLVADLSPKIVAWINAMSGPNAVTSVDVQAALDLLARDLDLLSAAVGP